MNAKSAPSASAFEPATGTLAAVVVNYKAASHLDVCLRTLAADGLERVVVVDNGSDDNSEQVARRAGADWIQIGTNLGYGRAANRGAAHPAIAAAQCLLVCNPDLDVRPGAIAALSRWLAEDPTLGAVGPRILNPDGSLYPSARTFPDLVDAIGHGFLGHILPGNPFTRRYRLLDWDHAERATVDWISGACLLIRRPAWDAIGGFDPAYFMYLEDVDLCWRLRGAGWTVGYEPAAEVIHTQGVSANLHPYRMLVAHHVSMGRFAWRTTTGARRAVLPLVLVGLVGRFALTAGRRALAGIRA